MVIQQMMSVCDPEDCAEPLLPTLPHTHTLARTHTSPHTLSLTHTDTHTDTHTNTEQPSSRGKPGDDRDFFLSRERNLSLGVSLLLVCFSAILVPAYLPSHTLLSTNHSEAANNEFLLNRSAAVLEHPCHGGRSRERLGAVPFSDLLRDVPVFLTGEREGQWELTPPMGLKGAESELREALSVLSESEMPAELASPPCRRCVVVGSGGVLHHSQLGHHINQYDIIIRMNNAPVSGYESDAGSRTSLRLLYPEAAPLLGHEYRNTSLIALVPFKSLDLTWLSGVVTHTPLSWWSKPWFWRKVVENIPLEPRNFRIMNPDIMKRTSQVLQNYAQPPRKMVPTLGVCAVVLALQVCDEVSMAGFGYDLSHPASRLHYYESLSMGAMATQLLHDVGAETRFLRQLVKAGVVNDLTGAI